MIDRQHNRSNQFQAQLLGLDISDGLDDGDATGLDAEPLGRLKETEWYTGHRRKKNQILGNEWESSRAIDEKPGTKRVEAGEGED